MIAPMPAHQASRYRRRARLALRAQAIAAATPAYRAGCAAYGDAWLFTHPSTRRVERALARAVRTSQVRSSGPCVDPIVARWREVVGPACLSCFCDRCRAAVSA
jgi:hypothetical protein